MPGSGYIIKDRRGCEAGISIVESTIVVLLISIVLAFALPAVSNSIQAYNLRSAANHLAQRLSFARAIALEKNAVVGLCIYRSGLNGIDFDGDGVIDTVDPSDSSKGYPSESLPVGISIAAESFPSGQDYLLVNFTSRGELPIGDPERDIRVLNLSGSARVRVNLRGKVWAE